MQIVVEINDKLYKRLFDNGVDNYDDAVDMAKAIRKGTPLPKGHGRLIDVNDIPIDCDYYDVDTAPTIIEADKEQTDGKT